METVEFSLRPSKLFVYYLTIVYSITVIIVFFIKIPVFDICDSYWVTCFYNFFDGVFHSLLSKEVAIQYFSIFSEWLIKSILILFIFFMYKKQIKLHGFRSHRNSIIHIRQNAVIKKNQGKQKEIKKTAKDKWMKRQYKITFKSGYSGLYTLLTNVYCNEWFIILPFLKSKYLNIRSMNFFNANIGGNEKAKEKDNTLENDLIINEHGIFKRANARYNNLQDNFPRENCNIKNNDLKNRNIKKGDPGNFYNKVSDNITLNLDSINNKVSDNITLNLDSINNKDGDNTTIFNNRKNIPKNATFNNVNNPSKKSIHKHINWVIIPRDSLSKQGFSHLKTTLYTQY